MNKVLIGFNIVLAAAVVYLFVKSPGKNTEEKKTEVKMNAAFAGEKNKGDLRIAYVNIDSLNVKYDLFKDEAKRLEGITTNIQTELQQAEQTAIRKSQALQNRDINIMTDREKQAVMMSLQKIEADFMMLKNKRGAYLDSLQNAISMKADQSLKAFLKKFSAEKKIDFVLREGFASPMLYGDAIYDITDVVAKALNDEYMKTKGQ